MRQAATLLGVPHAGTGPSIGSWACPIESGWRRPVLQFPALLQLAVGVAAVAGVNPARSCLQTAPRMGEPSRQHPLGLFTGVKENT
jgi:hypothetical protein